MVKSNKALLITIYIDYKAILRIAKQSNIIITVSIEKLNLCLVWASEFILRFPLQILHKPSKSHIVLDALLRLPTSDYNTNDAKGELDALHIFIPNKNMPGHTPTAPKEAMLEYAHVTSLVAISSKFKERIIKGYAIDKK